MFHGENDSSNHGKFLNDCLCNYNHICFLFLTVSFASGKCFACCAKFLGKTDSWWKSRSPSSSTSAISEERAALAGVSVGRSALLERKVDALGARRGRALGPVTVKNTYTRHDTPKLFSLSFFLIIIICIHEQATSPKCAAHGGLAERTAVDY